MKTETQPARLDLTFLVDGRFLTAIEYTRSRLLYRLCPVGPLEIFAPMTVVCYDHLCGGYNEGATYSRS